MLQVVLPGAPLQESETLPLSPPAGASVSVYVPELPRVMVWDVGVAEMEKSVMVCVSGAVALPLKLGLEDTNAAVSECVPPDKDVVLYCAVPPESETEAKGVVPPSK